MTLKLVDLICLYGMTRIAELATFGIAAIVVCHVWPRMSKTTKHCSCGCGTRNEAEESVGMSSSEIKR